MIFCCFVYLKNIKISINCTRAIVRALLILNYSKQFHLETVKITFLDLLTRSIDKAFTHRHTHSEYQDKVAL